MLVRRQLLTEAAKQKMPAITAFEPQPRALS